MGAGRQSHGPGIEFTLPAPSLALSPAFGLGSRACAASVESSSYGITSQGADSTPGTLSVLPVLAGYRCHSSGLCVPGWAALV